MLGRNTQGVRLIKTKENEHIVGIERIEERPDAVLDTDAGGEGSEGNVIEGESSVVSDENGVGDAPFSSPDTSDSDDDGPDA